jgi:hypothetical protein
MIDKHAFWAAWERLCRRFGRELDKDEAEDYHNYLDNQLDTEAFLAAARKLWASREFFPRPDDFVEASAGSTDEQALEQWQLCNRLMRGDDVLDRMTEAGRKTVALMGGPLRLRQTPIDEVHFRRAEFIRLFGSATEIYRREKRPELPPWTDRDTERLREIAPDLRLLGGGE